MQTSKEVNWFHYEISSSGSLVEPDISKKQQKRACHHCRKAHIGCDGGRPCINCVKKKRHCFEFEGAPQQSMKPVKQKSHGRKSKTANRVSKHNDDDDDDGGDTDEDDSAVTASTPTTETRNKSKNVLVDDDSANKTDLLIDAHAQLQKLQLELAQQRAANQQMELMLQKQQQTVEKFVSDLQTPRNEFTIDMFDGNIPDELQKPILVWECRSYDVVGCNGAFRRMSGLTVQFLKQRPKVFDFVQPGNRTEWRTICDWFVRSKIRVVKSCNVMQFNGKQVALSAANHLERSFVWVEFDVVDVLSDDFYIDDIHVPATYSSNIALLNNPAHPQLSMKRLLEVLWMVVGRAAFSDDYERQTNTLYALNAEISDTSPQINHNTASVAQTQISEAATHMNRDPIVVPDPSFQSETENQYGTTYRFLFM